MSSFLTPRQLFEAVRFRLRVNSLPDRKYIRDEMLPAITRTNPDNVLLVGTRRYTANYPKYLRTPTGRVWTVDIDPQAAKFGNGEFHRVGDVCEIAMLIPGVNFDVILANGLLGFGIDSEREIKRFTQAIASVLGSQGYLMLGWDAHRTADPKSNADIVRLFRHTEFVDLPARQNFVGCAGFDHVFDWFQKISR